MRVQICGSVLFVLLVGSVSARVDRARNAGVTAQDCATADWQVIETDGEATFRLPPGFVKRNLKETGRTEYSKNTTNLVFILGHSESLPYQERRQKGMNDYEERATRIRGKRANIRTFWEEISGKRVYRAELNVGNWQSGEVEFYLRVEGADPTVLDLAKAVFASLTFPLATPEHSRSGH